MAATASAAAPGVVVADTDVGYDRVAHTWDDSHPNAMGEVMISAAVADALAAARASDRQRHVRSHRSRSGPASRP